MHELSVYICLTKWIDMKQKLHFLGIGRHYIRKEIHTRTDFAAKQLSIQVKRLSSITGSHFGVASCKWSRKFVQAKRIYDHYVQEHENSL